MAIVEIEELTKRFNDVTVLNGLSLTVDAGEIVSLLGPSGCGKSTTLRCLAGLERPDGGSISINGQCVTSADTFVPPERRGIGLVFQSYALWPHMTCRENVGLALKVRRLPTAKIREQVNDALALVGLAELGDRYPSQLSGGQQQRIALARSIAAKPAVLLLDEPLSNLDTQVRERVRLDLEGLLRSLEITTVYVTHDQTEANSLSDRVIVMSHGIIEQQGTPSDLLEHPKTRFVAEFLGWSNFVPVRVRTDGRKVTLVTDQGQQICGPSVDAQRFTYGWLSFRPRDAIVSLQRSPGENCWPVKITRQVYLGDYLETHLQFGGVSIRSHNAPPLTSADEAFLSLSSERLRFFPGDSMSDRELPGIDTKEGLNHAVE